MEWRACLSTGIPPSGGTVAVAFPAAVFEVRLPVGDNHRSMRVRPSGMRVGVLAAVGVATATVVMVLVRSDSGDPGDSRVERVKDAIAWPDSCADVVTSDMTGRRNWPHATKAASVECEHLGPLVLYARFASEEDLRRDLLGDPPSAPTCIVGREVLIDYLDPGQFPPLCRALGGDRIDAVSRLRETRGDGTIEGEERAAEVDERRGAAAQRRALRRYWGSCAARCRAPA